MEKKPLITIVTVTRNAETLLQQTIESVQKQNYPNLEYIVIDGNSSDNSLDLIRHNSRISRWISEPDRGIYDAMNKGIDMAAGDWILFLNAGDTFASSDALSALINASANADVVYGDVVRGGKPDSEEGILKHASQSLKGHRLPFCHQSVIIRRRLLKVLNFDISHKYSADFKQYKELIKAGARFKYIPKPIARFDTSGLSSSRRSSALADNMSVVWQVNGPLKGLPHLLHLLPSFLLSRLRGK